MARKTTRRDFVKTSAAVGTAFWVGGQTASATPRFQVEKLNVGSIGVDGKGSSDSSNTSGQGANLVALCDIDEGKLDKKHKEFPKAEKHKRDDG